MEPELFGAIADGEELQTLYRFQRFDSSPANGDYIEGVAAVVSEGGLVIGIHRRLYVTWIAPAIDPVVNFSRYFATVLALPVAMSKPDLELHNQCASPLTLLEAELFASPLNLPQEVSQ